MSPAAQLLIRARNDRLLARFRAGELDLAQLGKLARCIETELAPRWQREDVRIVRIPDPPQGEWWRQ